MDEEKWESVKAIFLEALEKDAAGRAEYLNGIGGEGLRAEVESLLAAHEGIEDFIEEPAFQIGDALSGGAPPEREKRLGNYKLIREIGRGGMGAVYLAVRGDAQFNKRVAIKLLRRGMDSEDILKRFRNEERILAALEHPNIARLIDAGLSADGLPYFVMDYIEGEPLDKYCDERRLSTAERLEIFRKVCSAVHYAHQNLVVHRDLKPGNIIVTDAGEPKLLDFGIAKLLNPELAAHTIAPTATFVRLMTPDYASPEQIRGKTITTASDVYSLGILLYRLLTGKLPYRFEDSSPQEIERVVCEAEPTRPSIALRSEEEVRRKGEKEKRKKDEGENRAAGGGSAFANPPIVSSALKGDLDNIVLTALRKEPQRRYKSVEQLAGDVERYLKGLPVTARSNTFSYRAAKFVKRHKVGVLAAALVVLSLIGGIVLSVRQTRIAQAERARAGKVNQFLSEMLNYSDPDTAVKKGENELITIKDVLDKAAKQLESEDYSAQPDVRADLNYLIGYSYNSQGFYEPAEKHVRASLAEQDRIDGGNGPLKIQTKLLLGSILVQRANRAEADAIFQEAIPLARAEVQKGNLKAIVLVDALESFAVNRRSLGNSKEAEILLREALALAPLIADKEKRGLSVARGTLSLTLFDQGKLDEAIAVEHEHIAELQRSSASETWELGYGFTGLGSYLSESGRYGEADENLAKGEAIYRRLLSNSHLFLGDNLRIRAYSLYRQGRFAEAAAKIDETLRIYRANTDAQYINFATALTIEGLILNKTGKSAEAEKALREAVAIRRKNLPADHFLTALARSALGECLTTQGKFAEAETHLSESFESLKNSQGAENPRTRLAKARLDELLEKKAK